MPIRVDAYITGGMASGVLARAGHLREVLETDGSLVLERVTFHPLDGTAPRPAGEMAIPIDDVLIAVAEDDPTIPVHANGMPSTSRSARTGWTARCPPCRAMTPAGR